jgi:hypothetical protein
MRIRYPQHMPFENPGKIIPWAEAGANYSLHNDRGRLAVDGHVPHLCGEPDRQAIH